MKRTWRQREAPDGVALGQLTSFLQALQLGHPGVSQVRKQERWLLSFILFRWEPGNAQTGEQVSGCVKWGVHLLERTLSGTEPFSEGSAVSHVCFLLGLELSHRRRALLPTAGWT